MGETCGRRDSSPLLRHKRAHPAIRAGGVQGYRRAGWVAAVAGADLVAALPSGGRKSGITRAERIINTAIPTRISTNENRNLRLEFCISNSLIFK